MKKITLFLLLSCQITFGQWTQIGQTIEAPLLSTGFGADMSMNDSGDIMAISETGNVVKVYDYKNNTWSQIGSDINFGNVIGLNSQGNILAVGNKLHQGQDGLSKGGVKVYENNNGLWQQKGQTLEGEFKDDNFGEAVSLNLVGDMLAVGAPRNHISASPKINNAGHVRVFKFENNTWIQVGGDIDGLRDTTLGADVVLSEDGRFLAAGAPLTKLNSFFSQSGEVRFYELNQNDTAWGYHSRIKGAVDFGRYGDQIAMSGDGSVVALGATNVEKQILDNGSTTTLSEVGEVKIFIYDGGKSKWLDHGRLRGDVEEERFGLAYAINKSGDRLFINTDLQKGVKVYEKGAFVSADSQSDFYEWDNIFELNERGVNIATNKTGTIFSNVNKEINGVDLGRVKVYGEGKPLSQKNQGKIQGLILSVQNQKVVANIETGSLDIYNLLGQSIPNHSLVKGIYIVNAKDVKGNQQIVKVLVQ